MKVLSKQVRTAGKSVLVAVRDAVVQIDALVAQTLGNAEKMSTRLVAHYARVMNMIIKSVQQHTILLHNSFVAINRSLNGKCLLCSIFDQFDGANLDSNVFCTWLAELVASVHSTVMSVKEVQELTKLYKKYSSWLAEFSVHKYIDDVIEYLTM